VSGSRIDGTVQKGPAMQGDAEISAENAPVDKKSKVFARDADLSPSSSPAHFRTILEARLTARPKRSASAVHRIGIISDTHGLLRPQVKQRLAGVAHIIHGGDIGKPDVIAELLRIAPVTAIRGNIDTGQWAEEYPETEMLRFGGRTIYVLHDVQELRLDPLMCGVDVVVSGHSHRPRIETIGGVLYLNPGSAGPRRFNLPVTLATLDLTACGPRPLIHDLGVGA
jgi:putative phosphoesterase